jgi:hypothetical protein
MDFMDFMDGMDEKEFTLWVIGFRSVGFFPLQFHRVYYPESRTQCYTTGVVGHSMLKV